MSEDAAVSGRVKTRARFLRRHKSKRKSTIISKKEPDLFEKVREIAMEMITEYRQSKDNENNPNLAKSPTITHDLPTAKPQHPPPPEIHISQSQSLFDDTGVMECDPESDLKRKIFETDGEDEDSQTNRP